MAPSRSANDRAASITSRRNGSSRMRSRMSCASRSRGFRALSSRSATGAQRGPAGIGGARAEFFFDAQELVVFRGSVGTGERSGLDLSAIGGNGEIGDRGILRLAGAVGHDRAIAGLVRHLHGFQRFTEG